MEKNDKGAKKTGRSRYWSVMLVGDHGRVIPFRHFKALTVGVGIVLMLSLCALIILGVLYTHQRGQIGALQKDLEQMRAQSTKLRDEKDLYLTELIALQKQTGTLPQDKKPADEARTSGTGGPPAVTVVAEEPPAAEKAAPEIEEVKKEIPVREAEPQVRWSADIRNFRASYDNRQGVLTAEFRIYNTSRPKKRLNGRTVVIFKAMGDSPNNWAIVPEVPLHKETPVGKEGRSFSIRNYQTERFKTSRRKNSPQYDLAAVYVFADHGGELIGHKEMPFNVDYRPPAPPKPVAAPPKPKPEKAAAPPRAPQVENAAPSQNAPAESMTPNPDQTKEVRPDSVQPPDSSSGPPTPVMPPDDKQPKSGLDVDQRPSEPEASGAVPQTPAAEPKPAQEGDTQ